MTRQYKTIFISDTHLGMRDCQIDKLLKFLRTTDAETYYLVGDIVDEHDFSRWPRQANDFLKFFIDKAKKKKVIYIPGNHDVSFRQYIGQDLGGIQVKEWDIYENSMGYRFFITHGDQFDVVIKHARWLVYIGDNLYYLLLRFNRIVNFFRKLLNRDYWSFSLWAKQQTKAAIKFISNYEDYLAAEAKFRDCHAVICGHIHNPVIKPHNNITYINCGDWVENCTAVVENFDGSFDILKQGV